jgi:hypothetical protein
LVAGALSFCFLTPDFIIYTPINMKTAAPTTGGTQLSHEKYAELDDRNAEEAYQIIENRMNDAMPRISSPIQKTEVFSPSNIFYQMCVAARSF